MKKYLLLHSCSCNEVDAIQVFESKHEAQKVMLIRFVDNLDAYGFDLADFMNGNMYSDNDKYRIDSESALISYADYDLWWQIKDIEL